jgi:hypothetical protein
MLRGSQEVLDTVCSHLGGIKPGDTTKDGKFTVIEVECQGACSNAPMMAVNDDFYEDLTPETTIKVLDGFAKGVSPKPKPGPQSTRHTSENSAGLTALTSKVISWFWVRRIIDHVFISHMGQESTVFLTFNSVNDNLRIFRNMIV